MAVWNWVRWVIGYTEAEIDGAYGEKWLSRCMSESVDVWNIRRVCPGRMRVCVFSFDAERIEAMALRCGVTVRTVSRRGLSPLLRRYAARPGIAVGAVLYLAVLWFLSSLIWAVDVPDTDAFRAARVRESLAEIGFGIGSFSPTVDYRSLKHELMLNNSELSFASVYRNGCRAVVEVRFADDVPERLDTSTPCNLVASRDGQIVSILVRDGVRCVAVGQSVRKGDLLVGGIVDTRLGYYTVHARAEIKARVIDTDCETVLLRKTESVRTGRRVTVRSWNFYGKTVSSNETVPFETFECETEVRRLSFGDGVSLPISQTVTVYFETVSCDRILSEDEATETARIFLNERDRIRLCGAVIESEEEWTVLSENAVTLVRERCLIENIAEEEIFYFDDEG